MEQANEHGVNPSTASGQTKGGRSTRLPGFYKKSVEERLKLLQEQGLVLADDWLALQSGRHQLNLAQADKMIENVIAVQGMPVGLGLNFLINGKDYIIPMTVEEPSIVAALSSAAKLARVAGGFTAESTPPILIGQVQVMDVAEPQKASAALLARREEILNLANSLHPNMVARGGGAEDLEVRLLPTPDNSDTMLVLHLLVNTCDAMGANLVNTMCEGVAPLVEAITGGKVLLRILSNLTDRALVKARMMVPVSALAANGRSGEEVRDGVIRANDFAIVDPYRAATHNKGIMNGVDAVAIATGNDWRALEAAAHAYAARNGRYTALTRWHANEAGDLVGEIEMPMKVGTVGGNLQSNPTVGINHRLLGIESGRELAEVMGVVGLAQNFSAIKALATDGIQRGHMTLHARSVAMAAGAPAAIFDAVVERLLEAGEIKMWKAKEIIAGMSGKSAPHLVAGRDREVDAAEWSVGYGKIILMGEHAVVYGRHAIAAPLPLAVRARVEDAPQETTLFIPRWGLEQPLRLHANHPGSFLASLGMLMEKLGIADRALNVHVVAEVPRAVGLGSSSALAVAVVRALDRHCRLGLPDEQISALAFECEKFAHGTPSGIDNTVATRGEPLLFRRGEQLHMERLQLRTRLPLVVGICAGESLTAKTVARVRRAWEKDAGLYEKIFDGIDQLTLRALDAINRGDLELLGELMNVCQGQLNALQVSSPELEQLIQLARNSGAVGAKLTGGGGGGAMIALCPQGTAEVAAALRKAGYQAMEVALG